MSALASVVFLVSACAPLGRPQIFPSTNTLLPQSPSTMTATPAPTFTPAPDFWPTFAPPGIDPATPIPASAERLLFEDDDIRVWVLLGAEGALPVKGRTNAIHLLLINERLAKASVVSIPGNLYVYIPGHTMQRINAAYPLGGMSLVADTLAYNFGIRPDRFVVVHPTEFQWLVDDLDGVDVSVLFPVRDACGGLPAGLHSMDGEQAYCYVSYLSDDDEINRTRRQQQVLQLLFTNLVRNGRLAKMPAMYLSYQDYIETDISLFDLLLRVPLALRLGDPQRTSYFVVGWEQVTLWELPDHTKTSVLLPRSEIVTALFQQALAAVGEASPLGEVVLTYEAQLTAAVAQTQTAQVTPTQPITPPGTELPGVTPSPSSTPPPGTTPTRTPTRTATVSATSTPPIAPTAPYPIDTATLVPTVVFDTPTPYPP